MAKDTVEVKIFAQTSAAVKNFVKFAAVVTAAVIAIKQVHRAAKVLVDAYRSQEQATTKLNAALKATSGTVGISSRAMQEMATELSHLTGMADEAIIEAQALMVTFTQVGKKVFPEAIKAAADMAKMFGQDLQQSVIQLGTALNDPIAGVGRLKRIGISFTQDQRQSIKVFMAQNDVMSAQRVILDELAVEFGGVAEAMGGAPIGALDRLGVAFTDLKQVQGKALTEGLQPYVEELTDLIEKTTEAAKVMQTAVKARAAMGTKEFNVYSRLAIAEEELQQRKIELSGQVGWAAIKVAEEQAMGAFVVVEAIKREVRIYEELMAELENVRITRRETAKEEEAQIAASIAATEEWVAKVTDAYDKTKEGRLAVIEAELKWFEEAQKQAKLTAFMFDPIIAGLYAQRDAIVTTMEDTDVVVKKTFENWVRGGQNWLDMQEKMAEAAARLKEEEEARGAMIQQVWVDGIANSMQQMGAALLEGEEGWRKLGQSITNIIADILAALGKEFFAAAVGKAAAIALGPGPLFAAAAGALIAAGLVRAIGAKIAATPLAEGGLVTKPTVALIAEKRPEWVLPLDRSPGFGTVNNYYIQGNMMKEEEWHDAGMEYARKRMRPY